MFLSRMKPLPRFIIIAAGVAALVYGAKLALDAMPEKAPEVKPEPVVAVPAESAASTTIAQPAPEAAPVETAPILQPAPTTDAGIANVLGTKK